MEGPMPPTTQDRAVALIRVSSGIESERSPAVQLQALLEYAETQDYALSRDDILDENLDDRTGKIRKVSGGDSLEARPKLARAIAMVEAGTHQVIISERADRQFRDLDLQRSVIKRVEAKGGRLESPKGGRLSHATAEDEYHSDMDGARNSYVKRTAKERSWSAVENAIKDGRCPARVVPGLVRGPEGTLVHADAATVRVVRRAFTMRDEGQSFLVIRDYLAANGIDRTRAGVQAMMASRQYVGEIHFGNHTPNLEAYKPPLIDPDLFDRVDAMRTPTGRASKSTRLLARLEVLRCGTCQGRMSASATRGGRYPFYRCANEKCKHRMSISATVENDIREAVRAAHRDAQGRAAAASRARQAAKDAEAARRKRDKFIELLEDVPDLAAARAKLAKLNAECDSLEARAAELAAHAPRSMHVDVDAMMTTGPVEGQRSLIRDTIERVTVHPVGTEPDRVVIDLF
jgi:DNA invertase Pin-like site-specific DNA recombinase